MPEAERLIAGEVGPVGPHQLFARQRTQLVGNASRAARPGQLRHGTAMEDLALDCAALDHCALRIEQPSRRAASSAWMVGGTVTSDEVADGRPAAASRRQMSRCR